MTAAADPSVVSQLLGLGFEVGLCVVACCLWLLWKGGE